MNNYILKIIIEIILNFIQNKTISYLFKYQIFLIITKFFQLFISNFIQLQKQYDIFQLVHHLITLLTQIHYNN